MSAVPRLTLGSEPPRGPNRITLGKALLDWQGLFPTRLRLRPFGADSDLRRWGLRVAERGGKSGKKRAIIAVARKLAVLLHRLWVSGEVYEPLRNSRPIAMPAAA